jgi:limonene-1,2-epoxide hydrolase
VRGARRNADKKGASLVSAVDQFVEALGRHDWESLAATLSEGVVRDGPFSDAIEGRDGYVDFLRRVLSTLEHYDLKVQRISSGGEGRFYAEVLESFDAEGARSEYPEILLFQVDSAGLINFVSVFMKTPGATPPVPGASAAETVPPGRP